MDILTLELRDVTVFQALRELKALLDTHPGEPLRVQGEDELLRVNAASFLEKQGHTHRETRAGRRWELQVAALEAPRPVLRPAPAAAPAPAPPPRPVVVLRSAFAPGDRALGRRLLLEALARIPADTPWLCLAHQAVELLEDPVALGVLEELQGRGIPVQASVASLAHHGLAPGPLLPTGDEAWLDLLARGALTVL